MRVTNNIKNMIDIYNKSTYIEKIKKHNKIHKKKYNISK